MNKKKFFFLINLFNHMLNLMIIPDSFFNGFWLISLDLLTFGAIISAILTITSRNPVISVLFLISLFVNIACYLVLLEISFIGLSYITVYVGAIAILFLFVIFLLDIKLAELHLDTRNKTTRPLACLIGLGFLYPLSSIIPTNIPEMKKSEFYLFNLTNKAFVDLQDKFTINHNNVLTYNANWNNNITFTDVTSIGNVLYTNYMLWFFVSSIILLLAMTAAISLTFKPSN